MTHLIEIGNHKKTKHVVCGDFNQDFNKKSEITTELIKAFSNPGFFLISIPDETTRNTTLSKSTIDIVFADFNRESNVLETNIRDRCSIIVRAKKNIKIDRNSNRVNYIGKNWSKLKQHKMRALLNCKLTIKLRQENHILQQCSTQEAFREIEENSQINQPEMLDKHRGEELLREKTKIFLSVSQIKHKKDRSNNIKQRSITRNLVRKPKYNFFENLFSEDNDSKKRLFYKFVIKIKLEPKATKDDTSNLPTATQINSYFAEIGPILAAKISSNTNLIHVREKGKTIYLEPFTEIEVLKQNKKL